MSHEFPQPQTSPNQGGWRSATVCSPANLLHTKPLSLPRCETSSRPWGGCHRGAPRAHGGLLLASHAATLLHAAQCSCSAGEDLALQLMAGAHTELLLRAAGTDRRGCVRSHTSEYLFHPLQPVSLTGARLSASRLLEQERKHGSRSQGLPSFSSTAGVDSLFGLT